MRGELHCPVSPVYPVRVGACTLLRDRDAECLRWCCLLLLLVAGAEEIRSRTHVGQGRRMRFATRPHPALLSSCMQIGTYRRRAHPPEICRSDRNGSLCFIGKAGNFGFCRVVVLVIGVVAGGLAFHGSLRCTSPRYPRTITSISCTLIIISITTAAADSRVGTAAESVVLARVDKLSLIRPSLPARPP